jgi:tetratricopeptide (TPR) repeat protein
MRVRFRAVGACVLALSMAGCAASTAGSSGGGGAARVSAGFASSDGLPEWVLALPEGTPPTDNEFTSQATISLLRGSYDQALAQAEAGIAAEPGNPQGYFQAGEALVGLGRLEEAAAMLDRAEAIYPRYVTETVGVREQAWIEQYNAAFEAVEAEDNASAIRQFERANLIYQNRPEAMLNLGSLYAQIPDNDRAIEYFTQAVEMIEGPWTDRTEDPETRASWLESLDIARFNRAQLLLRAERYAEAAEAFRVLSEGAPDNVDFISNYANALVSSDQPERAREVFDRMLSRPGLTPVMLFNIGVGLYQIEQYMGAARAFQMVLDRVPQHRDAAMNRAQALFQAEQWEDLAQAGAVFAGIDPFNENGYRFQAQALLRLTRSNEAQTVWDTMQELPWTMDDMSIQASGSNLIVVGLATNKFAESGSQIRLRFQFYDNDGNDAGSAEASFSLPGQEESAQFEVQVPAVANLFGFSYSVL